MKLSNEGLKNRAEWEAKGYQLPQYDREKMVAATKENPFWLHFGAGNLFRAFHAKAAENMLCDGTLDRGITAVISPDYEVYEKHYLAHDTLGIVATLKADGSIEKKVVGSVAEAVPYDSANEEHFGRLKEIFAKDSLQLATFTITEKGYSIVNPDGSYKADVEADFEAGPEKPVSYMGKLTALLYERYKAGQLGMALVSTDNCSHNGDILKAAVLPIAKAWSENGKADVGFATYVDSEKLAFTWSMIDKITPRPSVEIANGLEAAGVEAMQPVITSKKTFIAPFINAEEPQYLVVEDNFPNGRPALEKAGVYMADRDTVNKSERMKVTVCLNPIHSALGTYGVVFGYDLFSDEMKDEDMLKLGYLVGAEGMEVVPDPKILSPEEFFKECMEVRFPNPYLGDTCARLTVDISQGLSIRFGETIRAHMEKYGSAFHLKGAPLALAGWLRYLLCVDDAGNKYELNPDPLNSEMTEKLAGIVVGDPDSLKDQLKPVLANETIFGVNLYEAGLGEKVEEIFKAYIAGPGAVRKAVQEYLA